MTPAGRPKQMDNRQAIVVHVDADVKAHYQAIADREGTSLGAVVRRVLLFDMESK